MLAFFLSVFYGFGADRVNIVDHRNKDTTVQRALNFTLRKNYSRVCILMIIKNNNQGILSPNGNYKINFELRRQ